MACLLVAAGLYAVKEFQYRYWLASAWDLGIYFNALWTLSHGDLLGRSVLVGGPILGDAAQWILYPLAPLFALGGPRLMFALQAAALTGGALLLGLVAARRASPAAGLAVAVATVAHPAFVTVELWDWHPDALAFAFLGGALYLLPRGRGWPYYLCVLLALASKNQAVVPVAALGLATALFERGPARRRGWATLALALAAFATDEAVWMPLLGLTDHTLQSSYGYLGRTPAHILARLALHPWVILEALWAHRAAWATVLAPFAFAPLLSWRSLPAFAVLTVNDLSAVPLVSNPFSQYSLWALPFLADGAADAVGRIARRIRPWAAAVVASAAVLVFAQSVVPHQAWRLGPPHAAVARSLDAAAAAIPAGAPVYGQSGTVAHLFDRAVLGAEPYTEFPQVVQAAAELEPGSHVWVVWAAGRSFGPIVPLALQESDLRDILAFTPFEEVFARDGVHVYRSLLDARAIDARADLWARSVRLVLNGRPVDLPAHAPAVLWKGQTWVPLRLFLARVSPAVTVAAESEGKALLRRDGARGTRTWSVAVADRNGVAYAPLRDLARALGMRVAWDSATRTASLASP